MTSTPILLDNYLVSTNLDIFFVQEGEMDDEVATVDITNVHLSSSNPVIFKLKSSQLDDFVDYFLLAAS